MSLRSHLCLVAVLAGLGAACGGSGDASFRPKPLLAQDAAAQSHFRALRERWEATPPPERKQLALAFTRFVQQHPTDGHARRARLYLAWIHLETDQVPTAKRWLRAARSPSAGASSDLYGVVEASWLLKTGQPEKAYARLLPLSGTLLDQDDRLMCLTSLVSAAIAVQQERDAVRHAVELAALSTSQHRDSVRAWLGTQLSRLSPSALEWALATLPEPTTATRAETRATRAWLSSELRKRLSRSALASKDVKLAQRLLSVGSAAARTQASTELVELATHAGRAPTVSGRRLGLVLQLDSAANQLRSTEVLRGLTYAIDNADPPTAPQLFTRVAESHAEVQDAVRELAAEGSSLVIAGLDSPSATALARMKPTSIPILLMHAAQSKPPPNFRTLGTDEGAALELLMKSAEGSQVVDLTKTEESCGWRQARLNPEWPSAADAPLLLLLGGPRSCAQRLLSGLPLNPSTTRLALGLGAINLSPSAWSGATEDVTTLRVGQLGIPRTEEARSLEAWRSTHEASPGWYEALGRDAGRVARAALAKTPPEATPVDRAHAAVLRHLDETTYLDLWTTRASRLDADGNLPRSISVYRITEAP